MRVHMCNSHACARLRTLTGYFENAQGKFIIKYVETITAWHRSLQCPGIQCTSHFRDTSEYICYILCKASTIVVYLYPL